MRKLKAEWWELWWVKPVYPCKPDIFERTYEEA